MRRKTLLIEEARRYPAVGVFVRGRGDRTSKEGRAGDGRYGGRRQASSCSFFSSRERSQYHQTGVSVLTCEIGTRYTPEALPTEKSKSSTLTSFEFGPMDVFVAGNIAVVQGSDIEKSTTKGKDSSGKFVWMDVFVKRNGKWQAVRSQSAKVQ